MSSGRRLLDGAGRLTAILGPTNTGKTHRAIGQMLRHRTGMIGLPLRLLAREVYDRVVAEKGEQAVALITGEEKRIPDDPRYWVCTVEAMPVDKPVAFVAVDEIQLAGDRNRGHVFTDRILRARGVLETMFLGSDTIAPLLLELVPNIEIERQERLSKLSFAGCSKLTAVPRRSAVVAFSAVRVYEHAERLRSLHGGAAVVLGALSPRTRNAQVAMFQAGEVHYMVATDAIGMGLNLDVGHVAFTANRKFDGRGHRDLSPAEVAQIAGRAGRFRTDGTFGSTRDVGPLDPEVVEAVENHRFQPLSRLYWRNAQLSFDDADGLVRSLRRRPPRPFLVPMHDEEDQRALEELLRRPAIRDLATDADRLRRLWTICQIPDFRKTLTGSHVELLGTIAGHLLGEDGLLPEDWVAGRIGRLDEPQGDIETLMARIAYIRTWTYIAFQRRWLADAAHWQGLTRQIEDRLSDALHERLTRRFVDRRAVQVRGGIALEVEVTEGTVRVGGTEVARLEGLVLTGEEAAEGAAGKAFTNAVRRALKDEIAARAAAVAVASASEITLDERGRFWWGGARLGRLVRGPGVLEPKVQLHRLDLLDVGQKDMIRQRLVHWVRDWVDELMTPLRRPVEGLRGEARGVAYVLEQHLGSAPRQEVSRQLAALEVGDRKALARLDIRLGTETVYVSSMLSPKRLRARAQLWQVFTGTALDVPENGRSAFPADPAVSAYDPIGYRRVGPLAVRVDVLERVAARVRALSREDAAVSLDPVMSWLGCTRDQVRDVVADLGFPVRAAEDGQVWIGRPRAGRARGRR